MITRDGLRVDGQSVTVEVHDGPDEPLLFLPGYGVHPAYYREGVRRLVRHFTVVIPDLSFRTHELLPVRMVRYRAVLEEVAQRYAPGAPRAGHSFGGLMALLGSSPAVALSPMIPIAHGWPTKVARAVLLQLREYAGLDGWRGVVWAAGIAADYIRTAVRRPGSLFPAVSETLGDVLEAFLPVAPRVVMILADRDLLYLPAEYERYLARAATDRIDVRRIPRGHDWPVTHPALLEAELVRALADGTGAHPSPAGATAQA
ncbi:MAG: alpha/beta hydrolase [Gemmatimonadota bacterium]|jgi:hypothetical protein